MQRWLTTRQLLITRNSTWILIRTCSLSNSARWIVKQSRALTIWTINLKQCFPFNSQSSIQAHAFQMSSSNLSTFSLSFWYFLITPTVLWWLLPSVCVLESFIVAWILQQVQWNGIKGTFLTFSCLFIHTWFVRHFFVRCLSFESMEERRRLLTNYPFGFKFRLIDELTRVFRPLLSTIWLCDVESSHNTTGCLWRVYRAFWTVDSFLVSHKTRRFGKGVVTLTTIK